MTRVDVRQHVASCTVTQFPLATTAEVNGSIPHIVDELLGTLLFVLGSRPAWRKGVVTSRRLS